MAVPAEAVVVVVAVAIKKSIMKKIFLAILFLANLSVFSQVRYSGFVDVYPIELVANISSGSGDGVYTYKKFDIPIYLSGKMENGILVFTEKDSGGKESATMTFKNISENTALTKGIWKDLKTGKEFEIALTKEFDFKDGKEAEWKNQEMLQTANSKNYYFKLVTVKTKEDYYPRVSGIRIYTKKTDKLYQELNFEGEFRGLNSIQINDYNFDGIQDFSVFEASYAGPNTTSIYYLFDPKTQKYFESEITGVSLEFDATTKTITEHNQCCAGSQHTVAKYKLKNNKMVLTEEHCYKWDEKKQDLVEQKIQNCR